MTVLIVEEDRALARVWAAGLGDRGFEVRVVSRLAEAMTLVRARPPALLIGALLVEGESLLPLIVAAQYRRPDLVTILLSNAAAFAHADLFGMIGSLRCVLGKPVLPDDLIDIAEHHLRAAGAGATCTAGAGQSAACQRCEVAAHCRRSLWHKQNRRRLAAPADFDGAGEGIRTLDPNLGKVVLYP